VVAAAGVEPEVEPDDPHAEISSSAPAIRADTPRRALAGETRRWRLLGLGG
jgi:hypothetical protein